MQNLLKSHSVSNCLCLVQQTSIKHLISMWITFLLFEDTKMLSPISSFSLAEDDITSEGFIHFGKLFTFPGSLSCILILNPSWILRDPSGYKSPFIPCFSFIEKGLVSQAFLESQRVGTVVTDLGSKTVQKQRKSS